MRSSVVAVSVLVLSAPLALAFVPRLPPPAVGASQGKSQRLYDGPEVTPEWATLFPLDATSVYQGRVAFFIWFFGASGGSAFPRMYDNVVATSALKGAGPTKGGAGIGLNPICGYPQDVAVADILQVVNNRLSIEQIVDKYPIENNFLSKNGYLTYEAFKRANAASNPLAVRVMFDAFSSSDACSPIEAQDLLDEFRQNPKAVASKAFATKLKGYGAIATLLFLLALADYEAFVVHARQGMFNFMIMIFCGLDIFVESRCHTLPCPIPISLRLVPRVARTYESTLVLV
jgi:hypothetical protein